MWILDMSFFFFLCPCDYFNFKLCIIFLLLKILLPWVLYSYCKLIDPKGSQEIFLFISLKVSEEKNRIQYTKIWADKCKQMCHNAYKNMALLFGYCLQVPLGHRLMKLKVSLHFFQHAILFWIPKSF